MFAAVIFALFLLIWGSCMWYLRTTYLLVSRLEEHHTEFWER